MLVERSVSLAVVAVKRFQTLLLVLCAAIPATPAAAQKIHIDYDGATAFSEYRTFQFLDTEHDLRIYSMVLHQRTKKQITDYLAEGGLHETDRDPDAYIAYYAAYARDLTLTLGDLEYAYGPGFNLGSYWPGGVGTRETADKPFTFREGTVVVDVWDRERRELIWRGMATAAVQKKDARNHKKLEKALNRLMKQWGAMYGDRARAIRRLKAQG